MQNAMLTSAAGLQYDEILHFYVENGKPHVNQLAPQDTTTRTAEYVTAVDFSTDSKTLAVGYSGIARLWDISTGVLQREYQVNVEAYRKDVLQPVFGTRVRYSPNGRYLAVTTWDEIRIYEQDKVVHRCRGFIDAPFSWSPDSRYLAGSDKDGALIICTLSNEQIDTYNGFLTTAAEWSPDGCYILVLSDQFDYISYLRIFDVQKKQVIYTTMGKYTADWNPNSKEYISGSESRAVLRIRDLATGISRLELIDSYDAAAWHPGGQRIATLYKQVGIAIRDAATGQILSIIPMPIVYNDSRTTSHHRWLTWNRDGSLLAAIDAIGVVRIWRESGTQSSNPPPTNTPRPKIVQATWTPIPAETIQNEVHLPTKVINRFPKGTAIPWISVKPSEPPYKQPNGDYAVNYDKDHERWVLDRAVAPTNVLYMFGREQADFERPSWSPDGRYLAFVESETTLNVFDLQTLKVIARVNHPIRIDLVRWHPTLPLIASESTDNATGMGANLIVYDLRKMQIIYNEPSHFGLGADFAWIRNTSRLLVWGIDIGLRIIEVSTKANTVIYPGAVDGSQTMIIGVLSPDERYLAFVNRANTDFMLFFFDLTSGSIVKRVPLKESFLPVGWSPDSSQLAVLTDDDTLIILGSS